MASELYGNLKSCTHEAANEVHGGLKRQNDDEFAVIRTYT